MAHCLRCQHELGVGRYCMNCGYPVDAAVPAETELATWRTDTTERAPVRSAATAPPPAFEPPPAARYPLFADEADGPATGATTDSAEIVLGALARASATSSGRHGTHERPTTTSSRRRVPWVIVLLALVLVALVVAWRLVDGSPEGTAADPLSPDRSPSDTAATDTGGPASGGPDPADAGDRSRDVTGGADVEVPAVAPASRDVSGRAVRYGAGNLLDGDPETAWRMPGDGTGEEILVHLDEPARLTSVGLLNGYAKRDPGYDGYLANRRVLEVQWGFDDGSVVSQTLGEKRTPQKLVIAPVLTQTVSIRLVEVSAPGAGRGGRDFTAISELVLRGTPA